MRLHVVQMHLSVPQWIDLLSGSRRDVANCRVEVVSLHLLSSSSSLASRSTTPSSEASSFAQSAPLHPGTYVRLTSSTFDPHTLTLLFSKHAETGSLGVVVEESNSVVRTSENTSCWSSAAYDTITYSVSSNFNPVFDTVSPPPSFCCCPSPLYSSLQSIPYISMTHIHAVHLATIASAGLRPIFSSPLSATQTLYILERPSFVFPLLSSQPRLHTSTPFCMSSERQYPHPLTKWQNMWKAWDLVTLRMIPEEMLHQKPIDLRHKCLFYIGHIPTFLDMLLSKSIGGSPSEPAHFWNIFERGIDPHVDDPTHCHNHSEVPDKDEDWPSLDSILSFRDRVRQRLLNLYAELESGKHVLTRNIARTLVMTLEHEGFHVETLLYMLIQRAGTGTLPPPGFQTPEWSMLSEQWRHTPPPSTAFASLGPTTLTLGHDDSEADDGDAAFNNLDDITNRAYGWDNESPARVVEVGAFKAEWRPISNVDYMDFWRASDEREMPKSWVEESGEIKVRTLYGPVPMCIAGAWPLKAFAQFKGGRLPTEPELRLFLDTYDVGHEGGANSYGGKGTNGGVWEWTSTKFDTHEGLVPTNLVHWHHVVLGASYATIPRLTRKTVRNFYQHNYPYPWVSARVVYDVPATV
ncbi:DUF323 domain-containing protein [Ephemerocybe angulata]|uniref:DUF323 domain-containing protein n=1 Tax=Ephemerocybe angulata TaxID=980116 RepID=A0A8H6I9T2_9AGAR|nr:DUF323 domain-containing protein [Tulosesus angulatus]